MKQITIIILLLTLYSCYLCAQVGINTQTPRGILHIDPKRNTPATGTVSKSLDADDVLVDYTGRIGLGTISPQAKLDIRGSFRYNHPTKKNNSILYSSDNDGNAEWEEAQIATRIDIKNMSPIGVNIYMDAPNLKRYIYTGSYITLEPGPSLIQAAFFAGIRGLGNNGENFFDPSQMNNPLKYGWASLSYYLSTSPTAYISPAFITSTGGKAITGYVALPSTSIMCSGFWLINNTSKVKQKLYLYTKADYSTTAHGGYAYFEKVGADPKTYFETSIIINKLSGEVK